MLLRGFFFTFPSRLFLIAAVGAGGAAEEDAEATVGSPHPAGASPGAVSQGAECAGDSHSATLSPVPSSGGTAAPGFRPAATRDFAPASLPSWVAQRFAPIS